MVEVTVRYDFPPGNPNPFERRFNADYFVEASGYSNLGQHDAFGWDVLTSHVPMGYKSLAVCRRIFMLRRGDIQEDWRTSQDKEPADGCEFGVLGQREVKRFVPDWGRAAKSYWLSKPEQTDGFPGAWADLQICLTDALTLSRQKSMRMLVVRIVESYNWH
ncbi:hypothetical protein [Yoonia sp. 2307UL14-13]|uniref:hypothetical protein n=1 Tax=Yoonia sp. 2307UL14-13 TaxID=3126506 RepID=UPI0030B52662